MTDLATRLRALMDKAGLKGQREAARACGIDHGIISRILSGRKTEIELGTARALASGLGGSLAELLGETAPEANDVRAGSAADGEVRRIPHAEIGPSPLNPRRHFDEAALAELAESILAEGVLQNLVVRPRFAPGATRLKGAPAFEIVAGERRFRAVGLLIKAGKLPADTTLPCRVVSVDDVGLLLMAMSENVQRASMHPLEEGAGYAALVDRSGTSTSEIARRVGVTQRTVQLRIALEKKLCKEAKTLFFAGEINLEVARALTLGDEKGQRAMIKASGGGERLTAHWVRRDLTQKLVPVERAIFPLESYAGEILGDEDAPADQRWFVDVAQFRELQAAAIDALEAELRAKWAWVDRVGGTYISTYGFGSSKDGKKAGAILAVGEGLTVTVKTGLVKPPPVAKAKRAGATVDGGAQAAPQEPFVKAHLAEARRRKTAALQTAIAGDAGLAMRLACLGLMGGHGAVHLGGIAHEGDRNGEADEVMAAPVAATLERFLPVAGTKEIDSPSSAHPLQCEGHGGGNRFAYHGHYNPVKQAAVWARLVTLPESEVRALFAALVAVRCGSFNGYSPELGDNAVARAIAETAGVEAGGNAAGDGPFELNVGWLDGYRKPALVALGRAAGVTIPESWPAAKMREKILAEAHDVRPPELRFAAGARIAAWLACAETGNATIARSGAGGKPAQLDLEAAIAERSASRAGVAVSADPELSIEEHAALEAIDQGPGDLDGIAPPEVLDRLWVLGLAVKDGDDAPWTLTQRGAERLAELEQADEADAARTAARLAKPVADAEA